MNFAKKFLTASLVLGVLFTIQSSLAKAQSVEKVLTLSVELSLFGRIDVPKLSLSNGPLAADESSVNLAINIEAFLKLFAKYKEVKEENGFFRESRNFRDGRAEFIVKHVDGTITSKIFSIAPNAPAEATVQLPELLLDVEAKVTGTVDVYKCFDANTCVFEETKAKQLGVEKKPYNAIFGKQNFRGLVGCHSDAKIEGSIDHPEIQRIILNRRIAYNAGLEPVITAKSEPVQTGAEFKSFIANLENFGRTRPHAEKRMIKLEVIHENDKLRVRAHTLDHSYDLYHFERCGNYP